MKAVSSKVRARLAAGIKKFQPILSMQQARDVTEADTSVLVTDMLDEVFGYDKFSEVTSEHEVHKTYCDKAISIDGQIVLLVEVKAIGVKPKVDHVRQATDYAAKQGVDWVALTNGIVWQVYRMQFTKPIEFELVLEFNFLEFNAKSDADIEKLSLLSRESWHKDKLDEYDAKRQILGKFSLAAVVLSHPVLRIVRRVLRKLSPGIKIDTSQIGEALRAEVIKRDLMEGEKAETAQRMLRKIKVATQLGDSRPRASGSSGGTEAKPKKSLGDIIAAGILKPPVKLFRNYKGTTLEATLEADGAVKFQGEPHSTCSAAAEAARKSVTGQQMNTNGWTFWRYVDEAGRTRALKDAYSQFLRK
jgi:hypothetical protein